jgi:hypothetical protein
MQERVLSKPKIRGLIKAATLHTVVGLCSSIRKVMMRDV